MTPTDGGLRLEVTIPVGSEAEVYVPQPGTTDVVIKEGGQVVWQKGTYRPGVPGLSGARDVGEGRRVAITPGSAA